MFDTISSSTVLAMDLQTLLDQLFSEVRNSYYRISESEEMIFSNLRKLTNDERSSTTASDNTENDEHVN